MMMPSLCSDRGETHVRCTLPCHRKQSGSVQGYGDSRAHVCGAGLADHLLNPELLVAAAISNAWELGIRHPIALANAGVICAERTVKLGHLPDHFRRLV